MISFNSLSLLWLIFLSVLMFKKIDIVFYSLCFTAILTTVAFFYISNESVLVFHAVFLVLLIKFLPYLFKSRQITSVSGVFILFLVWCFITIPFSFFNSNTYVLNINNVYSYVSFNFQQITQYAYLCIGFFTCIICNVLLINKKINQNTIIKVIDISYLVALCLALLQLVIPASICSELFRNSINASYKFDGARISGPFNEPSMLALVCTPLFCGYFYKLTNKFSLKYFLYVLLFIIVMLNNKSSSAVIGTFIGLLFIVLANIVNLKIRIKKKHLLWIIFFICFILIGTFLTSDLLSNMMNIAVQKLKGEGISGSERTASFVHHMRVFSEHFLFGIGYGTVRSYDLLSTWACEVGIIGLLLYFIPIILLCFKLLKVKTELSIQLMINIIVYNAILFSSTCEIMFLQIWIIYGISYYIISNYSNEDTNAVAYYK